MTFVLKYIRSMFMAFDGIVYSFAEKTYNLFLKIASIEFFETDFYTAFQSRIYIFLSVIMLFKLSFSLLTYIVNPDNFSDKEKGMGKLVTNSIIVICLIAAVPTIFEYSRKLQTAIVKENIIPSLILGTETNSVSIDDAGKNVSFIAFSAFFQLDKDVLSYAAGDDQQLYETCRNNLYEMSYSYNDEDNINEEGEPKAGLNKDCKELLDGMSLKIDEAFLDSSASDAGEVFSRAAKNQDVKYLADSGIVNVYADIDSGKKYLIDYSFILSTIAGAFLVWIFLMFCFDIAVRAVKLAFLELVAPIPIISYLDPKSGKSGIFSRWTKECFKTYADLFVRLIAIFFALFIISRVGGVTFYEGTYEGEVPILVKIFIIFGTLLFAKQLPKLIENVLGIKMDGKFTLSPLNKLQQVPIVGAATGMAVSRIGGGLAAFKNDQTGNRIRSFFEGGSAAAHDMKGKIPWSGANAGSKTVSSFTDARKSGYKYATGSEMKTFSPMNWMFTGAATSEHAQLKAEKGNLKGLLNRAQNEASELQNYISDRKIKLREEGIRRNMTEAEINNMINNELGAAYRKRELISADIKQFEDRIEYLDDQMGDYKRRYSAIDDSNKKTDASTRNYAAAASRYSAK